MIVTLTILVVDLMVLLANDVPILPLHALYIIFLTFRLARNPQPSDYSLPVSTAEALLASRKGNIPELKECVVCKKAKPARYYHCRHCSRCVYRLDHHCDFIGNCVGYYNFKVYTHFLVHGCLHSLVVTIIIACNIKSLLSFNSAKAFYWLTLLPALFGIYENLRLLLAFKTTIERNQTLIESYKQVRGPNRTPRYCFEEYFGKRPLDWFLPSFANLKECDLLEPTFPLAQNQEVKDYTFADEYLYGSDSQDQREMPGVKTE